MDRPISTIAPLKKSVAVAWVVGLAGLGAYIFYRDLNGIGLSSSTYYRVLGFAIYPLFYGGVLFAIYSFARMIAHASDYISETDGMLKVGTRTTPLSEIRSVEGRKNWIGAREILWTRVDGTQFGVRAYMFARPYEEILADLKLLVGDKSTVSHR